MSDEGGDGAGCFGMEVRADTTKFDKYDISRIWREMKFGL